MNRNRLLLVIGGVLVIVVIVLGIVGIFSGNNASQNSSPNTATAPTTPVLTESGLLIDNFAKDTSIDSASTETSVEATISSRISTRVTLAGTVRAKSLVVTSSGTSKNIRFIVDIPTIKQSYVASLGDDSQSGESSLYILCPSPQEMIYPDFGCKDPPE